MTRVRVVVPVVVIGDVIHLVAIGVQVALTAIPEVVVADSAVEGTLHVERSVALGFVAALILSVEDIEVVAPNVLIVGIEADAILFVHHHTQIAQLYILTGTYQYSEAVEGCIRANTFDGEVHVLPLTFDLQTDSRAT